MVGRVGSMGQFGLEIYVNCSSWSLSLVAQNSSLQFCLTIPPWNACPLTLYKHQWLVNRNRSFLTWGGGRGGRCEASGWVSWAYTHTHTHAITKLFFQLCFCYFEVIEDISEKKFFVVKFRCFIPNNCAVEWDACSLRQYTKFVFITCQCLY